MYSLHSVHLLNVRERWRKDDGEKVEDGALIVALKSSCDLQGSSDRFVASIKVLVKILIKTFSIVYRHI